MNNFEISYQYAMSVIAEYRSGIQSDTRIATDVWKNIVNTLHSCYWVGLLSSGDYNLVLAYTNGAISEINPNWKN